MQRRAAALLALGLALSVPRAAVAPAPKLCGPPECCGLAERLEMGTGRAGNSQIKGPTNVTRAGVEDWLRRMEQLRERCTAAIGYDGSISAVPELKWTQTAYISPQMHPYDRYFFDPALCVHALSAPSRVSESTPRADHPPRRCAEGMALAALVTRWTSGSAT